MNELQENLNEIEAEEQEDALVSADASTDAEEASEPEEEAKEEEVVLLSPAQALYEWLEVLVIALAVVMLVFTFVGRVATVDGGSMLPTLTNGERLLVRQLAYKPERGDIVVCQSASYGFEVPLVKRVIALGGQTVTIDFENWKVYVDGEELEEDYINYMSGLWMNGWDYGKSYTVPDGYVFVMGDNRNNSQDSRREHVGPIDERLILGEAIVGISARDGIRIFN